MHSLQFPQLPHKGRWRSTRPMARPTIASPNIAIVNNSVIIIFISADA